MIPDYELDKAVEAYRYYLQLWTDGYVMKQDLLFREVRHIISRIPTPVLEALLDERR